MGAFLRKLKQMLLGGETEEEKQMKKDIQRSVNQVFTVGESKALQSSQSSNNIDKKLEVAKDQGQNIGNSEERDSTQNVAKTHKEPKVQDLSKETKSLSQSQTQPTSSFPSLLKSPPNAKESKVKQGYVGRRKRREMLTPEQRKKLDLRDRQGLSIVGGIVFGLAIAGPIGGMAGFVIGAVSAVIMQNNYNKSQKKDQQSSVEKPITKKSKGKSKSKEKDRDKDKDQDKGKNQERSDSTLPAWQHATQVEASVNNTSNFSLSPEQPMSIVQNKNNAHMFEQEDKESQSAAHSPLIKEEREANPKKLVDCPDLEVSVKDRVKALEKEVGKISDSLKESGATIKDSKDTASISSPTATKAHSQSKSSSTALG